MKYGIYLPNFGAYGSAHALAELAQDAENAGWDGFFLWDHIAGHGIVTDIVDPWAALAAVVMSTSRIRLGTTVTPLPRRRPWKVARETVSLDHLSSGRLTLSVGTGLGLEEWDDLGEETDPITRGDMLDEALEVLIGLWSGEPFEFDGRHYTVRDSQFLPRPVQSPRIPIWVGGFWPNKRPFRRAAQWDGAFPLFAEDADRLSEFKEAVAFIRRHRIDSGSYDLVITGFTPGDKPEEAAEIVAPFAGAGATWWLEPIVPNRFGAGYDDPWPVDQMRQRVLQGPPALTA
jgi:alkanesulfonate monooxygenase SsuD/methylene tetrahydromethanopterin reductase-like flavin-dependent oxidoreductase (luciferase family)